MTSKHYKAIAAAIRAVHESYNPSWSGNLFRALRNVRESIADTLEELDRKSRRPSFNREKFLADCEPE